MLNTQQIYSTSFRRSSASGGTLTSEMTSKINTEKLRQCATIKNFLEPSKMLKGRGLGGQPHHLHSKRSAKKLGSRQGSENSRFYSTMKSAASVSNFRPPLASQTASPSLILTTSHSAHLAKS